MKQTKTRAQVSAKGSAVSQSTKTAKVSKTAVKQSTQQPKKTEKIIYLSDGVKGSDLQNSKIETNKAHNQDRKTFSYCLKRVLKFDQKFTTSFVKFNVNDCTPANLSPFLKTDKKGRKEGSNGFSVWLVMQLITRYYANKK